MNLKGKGEATKNQTHKSSGLHRINNSTKPKYQKVTLIAAMDENRVLGKDNQLIWHLPEDLKRFKRLTTGHAIIMGRKTFESLPKALPNRHNIVVTRNKNYSREGISVCHSLEEAIECAFEDQQPFVIGGGQIYEQALEMASVIELTKIHAQFDGDVFFPEINPQKWSIEKEERMRGNDFEYSFITYNKI
ncbi:MAG: dihydrofolate reductase [Flavobacteriaceae bacterium]|jgi:dihydrofolate reductase